MTDASPDTIPALAEARNRVRETAAAWHAALAAQAAALLVEAQHELPGVTLTGHDFSGAASPAVWWRDVWHDGIMFSRVYVSGRGWCWDADYEGIEDDTCERGTGETIAAALDALATQSTEASAAVAQLRAEVAP